MTRPSNPQTLYIMVTAYYDESYNEIFKKAGAADVVYKPIQFPEVDELIKKVLLEKGK